MDVSLIIPTYNKCSRLKIVLESLLKLSYGRELEIIIVNDGSTDDTSLLLEEYADRMKQSGRKFIIIETENAGRSHARNMGLNNSKGDLIVFSDDDLILSQRFIEAHQERHLSGKKYVVHGRIFSIPYTKFFSNPITGEMLNGEKAKQPLLDKTIQPEMIQHGEINQYLKKNSHISKFEKDISQLYEITDEKDSYVRWIGCTGGNFSVQKKAFKEAGGFDTNLGKEWGGEDIELGFRFYKIGYTFLYELNAANYHMDHYRANAMEIHEQAMAYFKNKHKDSGVSLLNHYFNGGYRDLSIWKMKIDSKGS